MIWLLSSRARTRSSADDHLALRPVFDDFARDFLDLIVRRVGEARLCDLDLGEVDKALVDRDRRVALELDGSHRLLRCALRDERHRRIGHELPLAVPAGDLRLEDPEGTAAGRDVVPRPSAVNRGRAGRARGSRGLGAGGGCGLGGRRRGLRLEKRSDRRQEDAGRGEDSNDRAGRGMLNPHRTPLSAKKPELTEELRAKG